MTRDEVFRTRKRTTQLRRLGILPLGFLRLREGRWAALRVVVVHARRGGAVHQARCARHLAERSSIHGGCCECAPAGCRGFL
jgi:hypothetical protein